MDLLKRNVEVYAKYEVLLLAHLESCTVGAGVLSGPHFGPRHSVQHEATAAEAAALKVFDYKAELEGPGAAHIACSSRRDGAHTTRL